MCRNIKNLFNFDPPVTEDEVQQAALQFVRKISGMNQPAKVNEEAYLAAVEAVAEASLQLLSSLMGTGSPKNRDVEAAKAKSRNLQRFGS